MIAITDDDRRDHRERHVAPRVERFARRHRYDLVAAVDEDQQQGRRRATARSVIGGSVRQPRRLDVTKADDDEDRERQELADGQHVDQPRALADAADVDPRRARP